MDNRMETRNFEEIVPKKRMFPMKQRYREKRNPYKVKFPFINRRLDECFE